MAKRLSSTMLLLALSWPVTGQEGADGLSSALTVCSVLADIPAVTDCKLNYGSTEPKSVDAVIHMSASEARKSCGMIVQMVKDDGNFTLSRMGWRLRILSPFSSGSSALAVCDF